MQLVTRGGGAAVQHCKANHAAINTAREAQQQGPGANMQVGNRTSWHCTAMTCECSHVKVEKEGVSVCAVHIGLDITVHAQGGSWGCDENSSGCLNPLDTLRSPSTSVEGFPNRVNTHSLHSLMRRVEGAAVAVRCIYCS